MSTIFPYMSDPNTPQAERERLQDRWGDNPFAAGSAAPAPEPETGTLLPPQSEENKLEFLGTALDRPVPLAYGRHLVAGAPVFQHRLPASNRTILFIALGDGEWDSAEVVWVNGRSINLADGNRFHFHPGTDGEAGIEPAGEGRNQKICSLFPSAFTGLTFSRTAYIALDLPDDPAAPGPGFDVRGIYRTRRVRIFDADGKQTGYAYSANPAWQLLDAFIALHLKPHGLAKEALTTAEKARIDFAAFRSAARFCDADIGGGVKRFESHVAFLDTADLGSIFETLRALCRGYLLEQDGKLGLFIDQPRRSVFTFSTDHILTSSLELPAKPLRSLANRLIIKARDLESGGGDATRDFAPWTKTLDDEPHQDRIGRILKKEFDLGANSRERAERVGRYWINRSLRLTEQARVRLTPEAGALMPGDRVSGPARIDYSRTRDWEVLDISDNPDGTRDAFLQEYDESIFSDAAESQQGVEETSIPTRTVAAREGAAILTGTGVPSKNDGKDGDLYVKSNGRLWKKENGTWRRTGIDLTGPAGAAVHRVSTWPPGNSLGNNGDVAIADDGQFEEKVGGIWVRRGDLTGSTGPPGADGATIHTGSGVPESSLGSNGDLYVRSDGHVWRKADGAWTDTGTDLTGTAGSSVHRVATWPPDNSFGRDGDVAVADDGQFGDKVAGAWVLRGDLTGPQGRDGAAILTGSAVPADSLGSDGDLYVRADGHVWRRESGSWIDLGIDLTGPAGASVHRVATWPPDNSLGKDGDTAIADDGQFGDKVAGAWQLRGDLTGPAGEPGEQGPRGESDILILNPGFEISNMNWQTTPKVAAGGSS